MVIIPSIVFFLIISIVTIFFFPFLLCGRERAERSGGREASVHSFHTGQTQMMKCDVEKKKEAPDRRQEFLNDNKSQNSLLLSNHKTNQRFLSPQPGSDEI